MTKLVVRELGKQPYVPVWQAMQKFTNERTSTTLDEIWMLEHEPVFTQGQAGKAEHILMPGDIPVVQVDRGGQVTYHGPGQLVIYFLIELRRKKLGVRQLVSAIEQSVVDMLNDYDIESAPKADAPGVYVADKKICSLGLRIRKGASFHGLALNVNMNKQPFERINPCGYAGMQVTQVADLGGPDSIKPVASKMVQAVMSHLGYQQILPAKTPLDF